MAERIDNTGFGNIRLIQNTEQFCYGIDAVLLATFAADLDKKTYKSSMRIADLGTNNGVVALILSYLTEADELVGVEVQRAAYEIACKNVTGNGLESRINMVNCDVLDIKNKLEGGSFDTVVSNPPYSARGTSRVNEAEALTIARHETTAELEDFIAAAAYLLKDKGNLYIVHRPSRIADMMCACRKYKLEPRYLRFVSSHIEEKPNIMLLACKKNSGKELRLMEPLAVYNSDGSYTNEIQKLYRRI